MTAGRWETAFDYAYVEEFLDAPPEEQDRHLVMTTAHEGEGPDDVAFFFVMNTDFGQHKFRELVVIHIGMSSDLAAVNAAITRQLAMRGAV